VRKRKRKGRGKQEGSKREARGREEEGRRKTTCRVGVMQLMPLYADFMT